jgi:LmbE family N-acetylglucosaminyl deacetylase
LRARSRPYPTNGCPVTLVVAPHPDDGVLGCGGLIARRRVNGCAVYVIVVTDGSASHPKHPTVSPSQLAALRRDEEREAMRRLGVDEAALEFLDAPDGRLDRLSPTESEAIEGRVFSTLLRVRPDQILLPCRRDGSSEHDACFALVARAAARAALNARVLEYPIWSWWNPRRTLRPLATARRVWRADVGEFHAVKRHALCAFVSQVDPTPPWTQPVLLPDFVSFFTAPSEYYFEMGPPSP